MEISRKACEKQTETAQRGMPDVYYPLHSLLHTLRQMEAHHDRICTLLTDIQRSGKVSSSLRRELTTLLDTIPCASLEQELNALASALRPAA